MKKSDYQISRLMVTTMRVDCDNVCRNKCDEIGKEKERKGKCDIELSDFAREAIAKIEVRVIIE